MKLLAIILTCGLCAAYILCAAYTAAASNLTNTVLMVDQRGSLNVEGVASVEDVATNAVKVQIAVVKAEAAQNTARGVSNSISTVVENIMSNNVVIYRSGFADAFAPLVLITDDDTLAMVEARWLERSASQIVVELDYVSTADLGAIKPTVMHRNTCASRADFAELDDANVTSPTYHAGQRTVGGQTFAGYYTVTVTIPNPASHTSYFLWIKAEADTPSGDGTTLDLPNGVTGGVTGEYTWGDKVLTFTGGVLMGVQNAAD